MAKETTTQTTSPMPVSSINPWTSLWPTPSLRTPCSNPYAAAFLDGHFLKAYDDFCFSKGKQNDLRLDCLPEPFVGDPDANVYLLNGNPGFDSIELKFANDSAYQTLVQNSLSHRIASISGDPFIYFNNLALSKNPSIFHSGCDWWQKRTNKFRQDIKKANKGPKIFDIEFIPYHSDNLTQISRYLSATGNLPYSANYSNYLIQKAIDEEKTIIIMRMKKEWLKRIPNLANCKNLYYLSSRQNVCITQNNLCVFRTGAKVTLPQYQSIIAAL